MPVRLTCPSCAATLSIRDEFATRAVKCPKCAGIIPPQPAAPATVSEPEALATLPPPPAPEPEPEPQPAARAERADPPRERDRDDDDRPRRRRDEDDEDDRPRRRRDEDEDDRPRRRRDDDDRDDDDRPRRSRRDDDDDDRDDDRPRKRRRRDEDEDDGPVVKPRYTPKGSNAGLIFAGVALVLCLGAVGAGIYAYTQNEKANRETEAANAAVAKEKEAAAAFLANFDKVKIADPRRSADAALGNGRVATMEDVAKVFRNSSDSKKVSDWSPKVKDGRVLFWQSEESLALVALHPDTDGRVMAKALRSKTASIDVGDLNDAAFLRRFPAAKGEPPRGEPAPKVKTLDPDGE